MHFLGLAGMPRRIPDYPDAYAGWNLIASVGSYVTLLGVVLFFYIIYRTFTDNVKFTNWTNTHSHASLEWALPSPPAYHTFSQVPYCKGTSAAK